MKRVLYTLCQLTWGLPQTLLGAIVFLVLRPEQRGWFHGALVSTWPKVSSVSLGLFVFVADSIVSSDETSLSDPKRPLLRQVIAHEYGHTIQSLILGPLYLPLIGIPSVLWANLPACRRRRKSKGRSYYRFYTERFANYLSKRLMDLEVPK